MASDGAETMSAGRSFQMRGVSKAFDKVLHNGLLNKLLDENVFVSLVLLLTNWYSRLCCSVKWNGILGECFQVLSGVRQGGVLSPCLLCTLMA